MKILSEYKNKTRRAEVHYRIGMKDYAAVLYRTELDHEAYFFDNESDAEDFAEDWVLKTE